MDCTQEYLWKIALRLKLRQSSGDAFQDFFSSAMHKRHGSDFVRIRAFGAKGDKGCDGYLQSSRRLYQCYGALNGDKGKVNNLIKKMGEDFATAGAKLGSIMKEWHMVHNLVDGLPIDAVEKLEELRQQHPNVVFGFVGLEGFELLFGELPETAIEELIGPAATNKDAEDVQVSILGELIKAIVTATTATNLIAPPSIAAVPADKLKANGLPIYWKQLIEGGWQNAHIVESYFDQHPDPMTGETIAKMFNERYQYLRAQTLPTGSIMDGLYVFVTGLGSVAAPRQVAAQALLAYLFESCDIFENVSAEPES